MNEPTEIKYPLDENGEPYFAATHINAVQGIDQESTDNALIDIDNKISQMDKLLKDANKTIKEQKKLLDVFDVALGDMVGDTGWVDISIPPANKNNANNSGFKSGIREVRVGNNLIPHYFVIRSIRLNISNITGSSMQIAQLPTGFITDNQSFLGRQNGYRYPITIECLKDGKVMAYVHPDDQTKMNWVYQEFTWLE